MKEKIYSAGYSDEMMWLRGELFRFELLMSKAIDVSALKKAVERTQKCYVSLQIQPALENEKVCYFHNEKPVVIRKIPRCARVEFGGEETNGYPWSVSYDENNLTLVFHHGLLDGRGSFEVIRTLLYEYAVACGVQVDDKGSIYTAEAPLPAEDQIEPTYEKYAKLEMDDLLPMKRPSRSFDFVKKHYRADGAPQVNRLIFETKPFMQRVKELNTSPFAFMSLLLFEGMRPLADVEKPNMMAIIAADMRGIFGSHAIRNFVSTRMMNYDTEDLDRLDDDMKCTVIRSKLDLMLDKDTCISQAKQLMDSQLKSEDMTYVQKKEAALERANSPEVLEKLPQFLLSYIGRLELPQEILNQVEDIHLMLMSRKMALMVECFDFKGKMNLFAYSGLNTDAPLSYVCDKLNRSGIPCVLEKAQPIPENIYTDLRF